MTSYSGYITYINYESGTAKGDVTEDYLFNNPFQLGNLGTENRAEYTSDRVTETYVAASTAANTVLAWTPIVKGAFTKADGTVLGDIKFVGSSSILYGTFATNDAREKGQIGDGSTLTWVDADGETQSAPTLTGGQIAYVYNNIVIPQNKLPTLKAEMKSIALIAHARRIAVYYSQIAAFQAKTDYGLTLYAA